MLTKYAPSNFDETRRIVQFSENQDKDDFIMQRKSTPHRPAASKRYTTRQPVNLNQTPFADRTAEKPSPVKARCKAMPVATAPKKRSLGDCLKLVASLDEKQFYIFTALVTAAERGVDPSRFAEIADKAADLFDALAS